MHLLPSKPATLSKSWTWITIPTLPFPNWFNPLLRLATLPTLRLIASVSKLRKLAKDLSSNIFVKSYHRSHRKYFSFDASPFLFRKSHHSRIPARADSVTVTPQSSWSLWAVRVLSSKTSHKLVGRLPQQTLRGESTSPFLTSTLGLFKKQRRKRIRSVTPTIRPTLLDSLNRFRFYLKRKLWGADDLESKFNTKLKGLIRFKGVKRLALRSKNLPRFRPYQFLSLTVPLRSFEVSPSSFFSSMASQFRNNWFHSRSARTRITPFTRSPALVTPLPHVTKAPPFRTLILFTFAKLPNKLRSRLRWVRHDLFLNARSRGKRVKARLTYGNYFKQCTDSNPTRLPITSTHPKKPRYPNLKVKLRKRKSLKLVGFTIKRWSTVYTEGGEGLTVALPPVNHPRSRLYPHKVISLSLLRQLIDSIRYAPAGIHTRQLLASLLLSPYSTNSSKLAIRSALQRLTWTTHPIMGPKLTPVGVTPFPVPKCFRLRNVPSSSSTGPVAVNDTWLPLQRSNSVVFTESPLTFESFLLSRPLSSCRTTSTDLSSKLPLLHLFDAASSPLHFPTTFSPFILPPLVRGTPTNPPLRDAISISPSHSKLFRHSYLFFTNLLVRPLSAPLDLLTSSSYADPTFPFNVFPDSNLIKVSVFRRLNRQKSLYEARRELFTSLTSPHLYKPHTVKREERPLELYSHNTPNHAPTNHPSLFFATPSPYRNPLTLRKPIRQILKVQRVRFKPGYGRIWRRARVSIREILGIPSRYQYRLTPKLQTHYIQNRQVLKPYASLGLDYLLMASHLVPDFWVMDSLLENKSVFLNGLLLQNPRIKVFISDFIQLTVNLKFFITLKWLRNWSELRQKRVTRTFYSKYRPSGTDKDFRFARPLPNWFFDLRFSYRSIPQILEVDFFTLSVFVIYDKISADPTEPVRANLYDSSVLNMYNWKYIT